MTLIVSILPAVAASALVVSCATASEPKVKPVGKEQEIKTTLLEAGANVLQRDTPVDRLGVYLVGFHPMKNNPSHQMEAHHFCNQVNEDFMQCALFDGNTKEANLNGVEFIISEKVYKTLPEKEQQYWHPHNYEILSGQLAAPGIPGPVEKQLMKQKMNSYGKTWHVWNTGNAVGAEGEKLPLGEPELAWSFNRNGEAVQGLVESRDRRMNIDSDEKRRERQSLVPLANSQGGVDALLGKFEGPTESIPGVKSVKPQDISH